MKTDKDFLRQLGNILGDGVRTLAGMGGCDNNVQGSLDLKEKVSSEVASAVNFLDTRDQFWTQIN